MPVSVLSALTAAVEGPKMLPPKPAGTYAVSTTTANPWSGSGGGQPVYPTGEPLVNDLPSVPTRSVPVGTGFKMPNIPIWVYALVGGGILYFIIKR